MVAQQTGLETGDFIWSGGDCHIYVNHLEQVQELLTRSERPLPRLNLKPADDLFSYRYEDILFENYDPHPLIKADVAV